MLLLPSRRCMQFSSYSVRHCNAGMIQCHYATLDGSPSIVNNMRFIML